MLTYSNLHFCKICNLISFDTCQILTIIKIITKYPLHWFFFILPFRWHEKKIGYWIFFPFPSCSLSFLHVQVTTDLFYVCVCSVTQEYQTLCNPMDGSPSVHRIFQARILEQVANYNSRESSPPRDWTRVSCIAGRFFTVWATTQAPSPL